MAVLADRHIIACVLKVTRLREQASRAMASSAGAGLKPYRVVFAVDNGICLNRGGGDRTMAWNALVWYDEGPRHLTASSFSRSAICSTPLSRPTRVPLKTRQIGDGSFG